MRYALLFAALVACSGDGGDDKSGGTEDSAATSDTDTTTDTFTEPEGLAACQSTGGRLNDTTCSMTWFCDDATYDFGCYGDDEPESCTCRIDDVEVGSIDASSAGEICGMFSDPGWVAYVEETCGF